MANSVEAFHAGKGAGRSIGPEHGLQDLKEPTGGMEFAMEYDQARFNKIDNAIATMAEVADRLEQRLNQVQNTLEVDKTQRASLDHELSGKMSALVDAQIRTAAQVARLENAFGTFAELAKKERDKGKRST